MGVRRFDGVALEQKLKEWLEIDPQFKKVVGGDVINSTE